MQKKTISIGHENSALYLEKEQELLIRYVTERIPREEHVEVKQLLQDFFNRHYLVRIPDDAIWQPCSVTAIRNILSVIPFACAEEVDEIVTKLYFHGALLTSFLGVNPVRAGEILLASIERFFEIIYWQEAMTVTAMALITGKLSGAFNPKRASLEKIMQYVDQFRLADEQLRESVKRKVGLDWKLGSIS